MHSLTRRRWPFGLNCAVRKVRSNSGVSKSDSSSCTRLETADCVVLSRAAACFGLRFVSQNACHPPLNCLATKHGQTVGIDHVFGDAEIICARRREGLRWRAKGLEKAISGGGLDETSDLR